MNCSIMEAVVTTYSAIINFNYQNIRKSRIEELEQTMRGCSWKAQIKVWKKWRCAQRSKYVSYVFASYILRI